MSLFEFLMVFVSLIVGLGVAEILTGIAKQIRARATCSGYWVHSCGVGVIFLALLMAGFIALASSKNSVLHSILVPTFLVLLLWDVVRWHPTFSPT